MSPYGQSLSQECFNFEVSCMSGSPSGRTLSNISRLDPLRTGGSWRTFWRFLMAWRCHVSILRCLVCQEPHQEDPYPPSPGWIFGWQVVPDTHFGHIICPFGIIFQNYGLKDVPEAEHKLGSPHTTISGLSTVVHYLTSWLKNHESELQNCQCV